MARLSIKTRRGVLIAALSDYQVLVGGIASRLGTGEPHVTCQDTHCRATQSIIYLGWCIPGYQWQIVQTRLKVDAQLDQLTLMCATLTIRLSLTASAPFN